jgi:hypothetical protein
METKLGMGYQLEGNVLTVKGTSGSTTAWWLAEGEVAGVDVSGLVVVSLLAGGRRLLLIDERVAPEQLRSLLDAFQGRLGGPLAGLAADVAEEAGCFQVPVSYEEERGRTRVSVTRKVDLVARSEGSSGWVRMADAGFAWDLTAEPAMPTPFRYAS